MTRLAPPIDAARLDDEWLEADGAGGFASGTVGTARTRRYHALLLTATQPPTGRVVLVNGIEAWLEHDGGKIALTAQRYAPDLLSADTANRIASFDTSPWPTWRYALDDSISLVAEVFVATASRETVLRWRLEAPPETAALKPGTLKVRPLLSGRDYHALHHENPAFAFDAQIDGERVRWQPYGDLPAIVAQSNGSYTHAPDWYRHFFYARERERGLDAIEDLATPGVFSFDLAKGEAVLLLRAQAAPGVAHSGEDAASRALRLAALEALRRASCGTRLQRSAHAYVVARGDGRTIVAGYPWFTDWGRDTFIALRGLLLANGRDKTQDLDDAGAILLEWASTVSEGMLPNRFPDAGGAPEYNSVDASLWFVVAVHDFFAAATVPAQTRCVLQNAVDAILDGYARGTRYGIAADSRDGLLRAGVPGVQLTWMDAKAGDWVVTPRIGKPVEIQALWINALRIALAWNSRWRELEARASAAFAQRFVDPATGALFDVIDVDHIEGKVDGSIRPNQIFALGGLPFALLKGEAARAVLAQVETHLLTPLGLRSLAPSDPAYRGRYAGGVLERDGAYHQGTVWPWLLGPFVDAWLRVHGDDAAQRANACARFVAPLLAHLDRAGLDHISEVADGDAPHHPGGTPFQAWSLGELLRVLARLGEPGLPDDR
ncbi:putative glycogen debranching enzyme [Paraburkholderia bannensis]|uniref:Putative glycogen debranching enzyme n=1 Tax=Paraburkholderia bannensis TaxID=765414 RepID=A0A7W9U1B2_9BURK|nr:MULTISPECIES: amylo-alpha-1,6-glucosidase [Paraburkholderia]MBB3260038.1 putative glycogen debranching enzyme [Paraburkholderia sp. WP4_3_2]MBB6105244.1 putative glycogen debranching enzyme [Paraburkholderia bannensis]